jgi:hypothetical protein
MRIRIARIVVGHARSLLVLERDLGALVPTVLGPALQLKSSDGLVLMALGNYASSAGICCPAVDVLAAHARALY